MQSSDKAILISITGGVATGKSTFCSMLRDMNFQVYSADSITHALYNKTSVQKDIADLFGNSILVNNSIDRTILGNLVFKNKSLRLQLNNLLHPLILKEMQVLYDSCEQKYCFFEVPLLFEAELQECFDYNVLVYASKATQLVRLVVNRNIDESSAINILNSQISIEKKKALSDYVIMNNESSDKLTQELAKFVDIIQEIKSRPKRELFIINH